MSPLELHIVTMVDNTTGAWVPEKCKTDKCLAVFGVMVNVSGGDGGAAGWVPTPWVGQWVCGWLLVPCACMRPLLAPPSTH